MKAQALAAAVERAQDLGHDLDSFKVTGPFGIAERADCRRCGRAVLYITYPYGTALREPCRS